MWWISWYSSRIYYKKSIIGNKKYNFLILFKKNFIEKILSLFGECFDKIVKTIAFACSIIDSGKSYVIDIVFSFKDLIERIRKISSNIIRICKNIINFIKGIKDIKINQIPKLISDSKDIIELFNCVREKLESLSKLIKEIMNKFNFETS